MPIDPRIFRAYDIRGIAGTELTEEACFSIGQAFGSAVRELYATEHPLIALGRDARVSGQPLESAVEKGLLAAGCKVFRIGQTPSPVNFFTICTHEFDGGVQVTASHNPKEDNGLKLQLRDAAAFAGEDIQLLRKRIEAGDVLTGRGSAEDIDAVSPYLARMEEMFAGIGKGIPIAVDCGNGVTGPVYLTALKHVGCSVTELYAEPDGNFPNHAADPSKIETLRDLQDAVITKQCAVGIAYDGDGDRVGIVDEAGTVRSADELLLVLARDHLTRHRGKPVIFTVSNSGVLETEIRAWGGVPIMTRVGHSSVEQAMREYGALLGGEQSGHFFCAEEYFGFDDALMSSLRLLSIFAASGEMFSSLFSEFPRVYQMPELRPYCPDDAKGKIVKDLTEAFAKLHPVNRMDGARIDFGDGAWAGIRQSNTSPRLSICIEARSPEKLQEVQGIVLGKMKEYPEIRWE